MVNKKYTKPALTVEQQVKFLISQGLLIKDQELANHVLSTVSYYRFSSYLLPFKLSHENKSPRQFKHQATFEKVWQLYQFDQKLRILVSDAIEKIEIAFRAALTNITSINFHPFWYVEKSYYKQAKHGSKKKNFFDDFLKTVKTISQNKQELFIQHYHQNYNEPEFPPIWMMIEALSFGTCSKIYDHIQAKKIRNEIAAVLGQHTTLIESWIRSLAYTRNLCAHHSRLWNRWFVIPPLIPKDATIRSQLSFNGDYRFYLIAFIILQLLKKIAPYSNWNDQLFTLFEKNDEFVNVEMGFQPNWRMDSIWNIS